MHKIIVMVGNVDEVLGEVLGRKGAASAKSSIGELAAGQPVKLLGAAPPTVFDVDAGTSMLSAFLLVHGRIPDWSELPMRSVEQLAGAGVWGVALSGRVSVVYPGDALSSKERDGVCFLSSAALFAESEKIIDLLIPFVRELPPGLPSGERDRAALRAYSVADALNKAAQKLGRNQLVAIVGSP